jgi:hypothetical protein
MRIRNIVKAALLGWMAVVIAPSAGFAAQAAKAQQNPAMAQAKPPSGMDAKCQAMMAEHEKMMADTSAADARLDGLVATMNAATGQPKADATAAVVSEMVAQRKAMRDGMMTMQADMMSHMMEHMQQGKDSMAMCPMMKMMKSKPMGGMKH